MRLGVVVTEDDQKPSFARARQRQSYNSAVLFDHLVGDGKQVRRNGKAKRFGGIQVEDQLELGRLLD